MKIAVTAKGAGLGAWMDSEFETCMQIVMVDDRNRFEAIENPFRDPGFTDPLTLANILIAENVDALITGTLSPEALKKLRSAGIVVYRAEAGAILDLVEAVRNHALSPVD
jgi:predicted Fe-Mo cluster-binding NifX family protein